jgi:anti-anti-sigma factor
MQVTESREGDVRVLILQGQLDGFTVGDVEKHVLPILSAEKKLVFDLQGVDYISSVGLGLLVMAHRRMKEAGGRVAFATSIESVRAVFQVSGLLQLFDVQETRAEAVASVSKV